MPNEPIECPRCHRRFGGEQALRRAHTRQGRPRRERCRRVRELGRNPYLRVDDEGVWHLRASTDPGQLRLPIFGRGRPVRHLPIYFVRTRNRLRYLVRRRGRGRPEVEEQEAA